MSRKGLDILFVHYGIRKEDMKTIEEICDKYKIDPEWVKEYLLKAYHDKKIQNEDLAEKEIKKLIDKALQNI